LAKAGSDASYLLRRVRPFVRRRLMVRRPALLLIRARKPCLRLVALFLG